MVASNREVASVAAVAVAAVDGACNAVVDCRRTQAEEFGRMHLVWVDLEQVDNHHFGQQGSCNRDGHCNYHHFQQVERMEVVNKAIGMDDNLGLIHYRHCNH